MDKEEGRTARSSATQPVEEGKQLRKKDERAWSGGAPET